jgi:hypothetical protein
MESRLHKNVSVLKVLLNCVSEISGIFSNKGVYMATKPKGVKPMQVEEVKVKSSSIDNEQPHDSKKPKIKVVKERKPATHYISHHRGHGNTSTKVVITKGGAYAYIDRKTAAKLVASNTGYAYGKKSEWKQFVRDATEPKLLEVK